MGESCTVSAWECCMIQGAVCAYGEGKAGCVCVYAYRCGVYLSDTPQAKKIQCCVKMRKNWERNQNTERSGERKTEIESVRRE